MGLILMDSVGYEQIVQFPNRPLDTEKRHIVKKGKTIILIAIVGFFYHVLSLCIFL